MRLLLLFVLTGFLSQNGFSQVPLARLGWCKIKDIELVTGDTFPENNAVIGMASFAKTSGISSIESLTSKIIKDMKKLAKAHHCCKVYVDFKNIVSDHTDKAGNTLNDKAIYYYTICPLYYLKKE